MDYRISELMSGYEDGQIDLADRHITTAERVKALTMERIQPAVTPIRRGKKLGRILLIAAALTLALAAAALAVYQYGLRDAEMELADASPFEESEEAVYRSALSFNGYQDSPEYQAYVEWESWNQSWQAENRGIYAEMGADDAYHETPDNYDGLYGASFREQADKLDEIMEKYGLTPHTSCILFHTESQLCQALGMEDIFSDDIDIRGDYLYDDGSFKAVGTTDIDGGEIWMDVFHAVRGSFSVIESSMPEDYEQWRYVTASGVEVVLAAAEEQTFMLAGLDGSYVTVKFFAALERAQAEALADGIDLAALNSRFATRQERQAAAAAVAAYEQARATATVYDGAGDDVSAALAVLGNYYPAEKPEDMELYSTTCTIAGKRGAKYFSVTHYYQGKGGLTFSFRNLEDGETELGYIPNAKNSPCTVNGYEAYLAEYNAGTEAGYYGITWLDSDREMIFSITCDSNSQYYQTPEDVIALAESVTAENPELETGSEAFAARAARYQDG